MSSSRLPLASCGSFSRLHSVELHLVLRFMTVSAVCFAAATCKQMAAEATAPLVWRGRAIESAFVECLLPQRASSLLASLGATTHSITVEFMASLKRLFGRESRPRHLKPLSPPPRWAACKLLQRHAPMHIAIPLDFEPRLAQEHLHKFGFISKLTLMQRGVNGRPSDLTQARCAELLEQAASGLRLCTTVRIDGGWASASCLSVVCALPALTSLTLNLAPSYQAFADGHGRVDSWTPPEGLSAAAFASAHNLSELVLIVDGDVLVSRLAGLAAIPALRSFRLEGVTLSEFGAWSHTSLPLAAILSALAPRCLEKLDLTSFSMHSAEGLSDEEQLQLMFLALPRLQTIELNWWPFEALASALVRVGLRALPALHEIRMFSGSGPLSPALLHPLLRCFPGLCVRYWCISVDDELQEEMHRDLLYRLDSDGAVECVTLVEQRILVD